MKFEKHNYSDYEIYLVEYYPQYQNSISNIETPIMIGNTLFRK